MKFLFDVECDENVLGVILLVSVGIGLQMYNHHIRTAFINFGVDCTLATVQKRKIEKFYD